MPDPAPPLTEAELGDFATVARRGRVGPHTLDRVVAQCMRALTLESELAQLRREKAEREELERRRDAYLCNAEYVGSNTLHHSLAFPDELDEPHEATIQHEVVLYDGHTFHALHGYGGTYEAALAAALLKLEKP